MVMELLAIAATVASLFIMCGVMILLVEFPGGEVGVSSDG